MARLHWRGATIDLTPPHPIALAGQSGPLRISDRVHSRLEANASVLHDDHGGCVLVVGMDLLYVGAELRQLWLEAAAGLGIRPEAVWLAASHSHFAPATDRTKPRLGSVDDVCLDWIRGRCTALLGRVAAAEPVPVRAEVAQLPCEANVNRRRRWPWPTLTRAELRLGGSIVMAPAPQAMRDTALVQIRFVDAQDRCRGVWWKYACHPVALPQPRAVSAEYPGEVRAALRRLAGHGELPVVFLQGFAGDVRPWIEQARDPRSALQRLRSGPGFGAPTQAQWQSWADAIVGRAAASWAPGATWEPLPDALSAAAATVPLSQLFDAAVPGELVLQRLAFGGELELIGGNAEFCSPWLRWQVPGRRLVHVGYLGHVFGYLPDAAQVREGGYEATGHFGAFDLRARWRDGFETHLDRQFRRLCDAA